MSIAHRLERWLEERIEGMFGRGGKGAVQPVEIGRRLLREMEANRRVSVNSTYVPNEYQISLSPEDFETLGAFSGALSAELEAHLRSRAQRQGYAIPGRLSLTFTPEAGLKAGRFAVSARFTSLVDPGTPVTPTGEPAGPGIQSASSGVQEMARDDTIVFRGPKGARPVPRPTPLTLPEDFSGFCLEVTTGPDIGRIVPLSLGEMTVGRDEDNRVVICDPNVSRVHAGLKVHADEVEVRDLDSRNGTYVNGERVSTALLRPGDELRVGMSVLRLRCQ